jgi:hypothetical protein
MDRGKADSGQPPMEWVKARSHSDRGSYRAGMFWPREWTYRQLRGQALANVLGCNLLDASTVDASEVPSAVRAGQTAEPEPENQVIRREGDAPKGEDTPEDNEPGQPAETGPKVLASAHAPAAPEDGRAARRERRHKR